MSGKLVKVAKITLKAGQGNGEGDLYEYEMECGHTVTSYIPKSVADMQQQLLIKELPCFARCPECLAEEKARGRSNGYGRRRRRKDVL